MLNCAGTVLFVFVCSLVMLKAEFQQQRAKIMYVNPKHVQYASIFTTRSSRSSPYSTDMNITTLSALGNNATVKIMYYKVKAKSDAMVIELKTCDLINLKWARDWVEKYSNMTVDTCPLKSGPYRFSGFELPPKNFPLLVLADKNSDYETTFLVYVTKTKERIIELSIGLTYKHNPKLKRNKQLNQVSSNTHGTYKYETSSYIVA